MKKNVFVIGSMNMDYTIYCERFPKDGETIFGISRFIQPGGKGANQAAAVAKSNLVNCYFKACAGNDNDGEQIIKLLSSLNAKCLIKKVEKETGNATIFVNKASENQIIVVSGANAELLPEDISKEELESADYVVLQNEIPAETNAHVIKEAHKLGKVVIYNPAPYREIDPELLSMIDYFVVNEVELASYAHIEDQEKAIETLLSKGIKHLIVTLGSKGSLYIDKNERKEIPCYKNTVVDTVAAGDTYVGYFAAGLATGLKPYEAMDLASRASSITVSRKGSIVSIPFYNEIKQ